MSLLLDTQVVLWLSQDDARIPDSIMARVVDPGADVLLSAIVLWEVAIKSARGKLHVGDDFPARVGGFGFRPLPVTAEHAWTVRGLPPHHSDPFDRLLVAQAQVERAVIVSADDHLDAYDAQVLWN